MSGLVASLFLPDPGTVRPLPVPVPSAPVPLGLPTLTASSDADRARLSMAVMDAAGRLQDRGAVATLGWGVGDRLLITLVRTSVVIRRRPDGVFVMPRKPYVVLPAPVRKAVGARAGSRLLLVADPGNDVLIVHPEPVVQSLLRAFHTSLATVEEPA